MAKPNPDLLLSASERAAMADVAARRLKWCRGLYVLLLIWIPLSGAFNAPSNVSALTVALVYTAATIPLLFFIGTMRSGDAKKMVWLGFVLLFYAIFASVDTFRPGLDGQMALAKLAIEMSLFAMSLRYVKAKRASQGGEF